MAGRPLNGLTEGLRASAPLRLDLAGGWTDVPPFSTVEGGAVVNVAIRLSATAQWVPGGQGIRLFSRDLREELHGVRLDQLDQSGKLRLLRAALRVTPVDPPFSLETDCEAPPGSGLGSSGAVDVALARVLTSANGTDASPKELAELARKAEAEVAGVAGGKQDQYAAAFGGFHLFEFQDPEVSVRPLQLDADFASALARQTVLCYTGQSRISGNTITRVMTAYNDGVRAVTGALLELKDLAHAMADALGAADLERVAVLLSRNWRCQQELDPGMQTDLMKQLEAAAAAAGALGGKAAGAGAGGSMFFVMPDDPAPLIEAATTLGMTVMPVEWSREGIRSC